VREIYEEGWRLGLKAVALYRDGCKASQPLSTSNKESKASEETSGAAVLEHGPMSGHPESAIATVTPAIIAPLTHPSGTRVRLPKKRRGFTQEAKVGGHKIFLRTGEYVDGTLGEIFIDMHKEGAAFRSLMNCFAMAVSVGLQYGVPLETYVEQFTFTRFEPQGPVEGHPHIKFATSIVDYLFRVLGVEYLRRYDFAQVPPSAAESAIGAGAGAGANEVIEDPAERRQSPLLPSSSQAGPGEVPLKHTATVRSAAMDAGLSSSLDAQLEEMMGDAPVCDGCGHITVRNGACYKCLNCGNSMGCS
jgi:ribonucleoside-diphosphate reductase alpha chain